MKKITLLLIVILVGISNIFGQIGRTYSDGHGGRIFFPFGDISFADEVVEFTKGQPAPIKGYGDPNLSLKVPDYSGNYETIAEATSLGFGGVLIVKFTDNILYDINGPDLFIFEIGPAIEPVDVYISKDGIKWISVGRTGGGISQIDISKYVKKTDVFRYVKIIDIKAKKDGRWPGADIDAIGAIGSSINFQLNSAVLFKSGESTLGEDKSALYKIGEKVKEIGGLTIIEGYTDNIGSSESNLLLSEKRAQSIKIFFSDSCQIDTTLLKTNAYGETNPIADNNTENGREKNRRVEIIVFPQTNQSNDNVVGKWSTTRGNLYIYKYGKIIAGWYESDGGEILGKLIDEHTIEGKWIENGARETCSENTYDRNHWGSLIIKFNEDFSKITMKWGYCTKEPTNGNWDGTRK